MRFYQGEKIANAGLKKIIIYVENKNLKKNSPKAQLSGNFSIGSIIIIRKYVNLDFHEKC